MEDKRLLVLYKGKKQLWHFYYGGHEEADEEKEIMEKDGYVEMIRIDPTISLLKAINLYNAEDDL